MKEEYIDLHVHSTYSDGTCTPQELVSACIQQGLKAFALTDHDTAEGIREAQEAARNTGLIVIPGIELSTAWRGKDIHILGLNIEPENEFLRSQLMQFQLERERRNEKIIQKMQDHGLRITIQEMRTRFSESVWTRAHFARFLMDTGQVASIQEAFDRFLSDTAPCFVPREKISPQQAVKVIHGGGGKAVLAHPLSYHLTPAQLEELTALLSRNGLDGLEALYSNNHGTDESDMRRLARRYYLFITGGSDFHGTNKPDIQLGWGRGNLRVPACLLQNL